MSILGCLWLHNMYLVKGDTRELASLFKCYTSIKGTHSFIVTLSTKVNFRNLPNSKWDQCNPNLITGKQTIEKFKSVFTNTKHNVPFEYWIFTLLVNMCWRTNPETSLFGKTHHRLSNRVPEDLYWELTKWGEIGEDLWWGLFWLRLRKGIKDRWKVVRVIRITISRHARWLLISLRFNWGLSYWWV